MVILLLCLKIYLKKLKKLLDNIMSKFYKIMGKYQGETEEIDMATSKNEADYLISEYRMAYGKDWKIWAEPAKKL